MNSEVSVSFSSPDPINGIVSVFRVHKDGSTETIGKIHADYYPDEGYVVYTGTDLEYQQIFQPSTEFTEIEDQFISYAKKQSEKSYTETMLLEAEKQKGRKASLQNIRNLKFNNLSIIKSI